MTMYQRLLNMYVEGKINESYLLKAVKVNWITESEMQEIVKFKDQISKGDSYEHI